MGVDLGGLVEPRDSGFETLRGQTIAIDAYNTLYQFLSIIRQPDGTPLKDPQGRVTSHLSGLLYRSANMVEGGVRPVFVFDGKPHPLKRETLAERRERKEKAETEYKQALAEGDMERARTKAQQTSRLTGEMADQARELILALGMSYADAPQEGEAQAVRLVQDGEADAVASQDFDALLFGAARLVRNLTVTGRRKLPRKQVWVEVVPEEVRLADAKEATGLEREQLIDLAMLLGTDFNRGVKGVGQKKALKLIQEHGSLEGIGRALDDGTIDPSSALHKQLRDGWGDLDPIDEVRRIFLEPVVADETTIRRGKLDPDKVTELLVEEFHFGAERVATAVARYQQVQEAKKQRSLDAFFG